MQYTANKVGWVVMLGTYIVFILSKKVLYHIPQQIMCEKLVSNLKIHSEL